MYVILVCTDSAPRRSTVHVVDEEGRRVHSHRTMQGALRWIVDRGEVSVTAMTDIGPELFLIEQCEGLQMTLPSLSLRRAFKGRCCEPPKLPGLDPDPALRARALEGQSESSIEQRRRRARWLRRATGPAANDNPA